MNIIVTGASRGIGYELVKLLSQDSHNKILAVSRKREKLKKLANGSDNIDFETLDLSDSKQIVAFGSKVKRKFNSVDILVNNAGAIVNKPFEKVTSKELEYVYQVNVFSIFQLVQVLLPLFGKRSMTHIVNIGSIGGFQGSSKFSGLSAYSSSKAALVGLSECLSVEFKNKNIAVNCLCLGAVQTDMLEEAFPGYKAPINAKQMAEFISNFSLTGHNYFNGKVLPVSLSTP